jgi:serine/threonine protein kinase
MRLDIGVSLGTFEILAPIGSGGMGEVYRARDKRLKRDVAVKVLLGGWADDVDRLARFEREAELLAALNHPNIAAIYGVEEIDGTTALILELVDGPTLADRLARGSLALPEAVAIARQIIDALDAAHEKGIVHRDLKPANVKLRDDGAVKVLDFGLAKALESDTATAGDVTASPTITSPVMTRMGVILGTAAYMSPEQARGHVIDKRTDIWAFGCVLYEMLTGKIAFERSTVPDTIAAILEREPDWSLLPTSTPKSVQRLLHRCLAKSRNERLRDIGDARHALNEIQEDARGVSAGSSSKKTWRLLAAVALLAGIAGAAVAVWMRSDELARRNASSLGPQFSRLTSDAAYSIEPALSRDGTMVVYASDRAGDGQLDLWLQRTGGGEPLQLTNDPADDRQPDFSPDGSLIVFRSNRDGGGVYVMPALGGNARLVAERGRRPRFSPDGRNLAYWTGPWLSGVGPRGPGTSVFIIPTNGGKSRPIAEGFVTAREPVWSPDGESLLFFGRKTADNSPSGVFDWWWAPLDGREPVPTGVLDLLNARGLEGAGDDDGFGELEAMPTTWTASGVVFSAHRGEGVNLWRLNVAARTGRVTETSLERLTFGAGSDFLPSVDGNGRVAFQLTSEGYVSLTLPLESNAGRPTGAIVRQSFSAGQRGGRNSLDASGRWLAYTKNRESSSEIWVKDLTSGQERHLVTTVPTLLNPVMSHDGTKVAYAVPEGGRQVGYVVPVSGGTARQVCEACGFHGWFADSRRIVTGTGPVRRPSRLQVLDVVDGTALDLVVDPTAALGRADIAPDSRWLSFSSRGRVWIAPARPGNPPSEPEWISIYTIAENSAERACGWSPDSRLLYLLLEQDGFRDLYAQRIDSVRGQPLGEPFIVQHLHDPRRRWGSTPLGTAIVRNAFVFSQVEITGSIWLLTPP